MQTSALAQGQRVGLRFSTLSQNDSYAAPTSLADMVVIIQDWKVRHGGCPKVVVLHEQFDTGCASACADGKQLCIDAKSRLTAGRS